MLAVGYNALTLARSLARSGPYETKSFATRLDFLRVAEKWREWGREEYKSLWGFVLGCSRAEGTVAASMQQCEWKITAQHWPQLRCFPCLLHDTLYQPSPALDHLLAFTQNDNIPAWLPPNYNVLCELIHYVVIVFAMFSLLLLLDMLIFCRNDKKYVD